ncbi:MAG: hypothetical protein NWQ75_03840 [Schleiferiaceae bacterium]|nr:hypothetical protein [Schleiferiaceae bacterium]
MKGLHFLLAIGLLLLASCGGSNSTNSQVPVWEFDLTINGVRSHFKSTGLKKDWTYLSVAQPDIAMGVVSGGKWSIWCNGSSVSSAEWVQGNPVRFTMLFDESTNRIELIDLRGQLSYVELENTNPLLVNITNFGNKSVTGLTTGAIDFGNPIEIQIPQQSSTNLYGTISISGTVKAIYQ